MRLRKSLSTKIVLMVEVFLLLSSGIFCGISINRSRIAIRKAIQQRMVDIANCASGSVNGDILKNLKPGDEGTPGYQAVYDTMAVFRDNTELEYIYTIRDEGSGRFTFIVDTDPDEPGTFGDEVKYTDALNRAAKGTTAVDEVPYADQWGEFYSAYSPVFDSEGHVAGIVATDFKAAWFDAQLQEQTTATVRRYVVILLVTLAAAAALCLVTLRPYVRQQEQLLKEKVTAESANQAKSEFLASMSHEIRTPINAVLGMNEMIQRVSRQGRKLTAGETEEARNAFDQIGFYANKVEKAGRSLLDIVNDILDFSRIEAGGIELVQAPYQLSSLLNDVTGMIRFKAREKGLEFTLDVDESLPGKLVGDEKRIREILTNILNNAVKYTEQGFVRLNVRTGERAEEQIRVLFTVEDSGIGIRQEDMGKLFDRFERLDLERNGTVEGSGLGLAIARELLEKMGGTIQVRSEYGKGSVFTITIPQRMAEADGAVLPEADAARDTGRREAFRAPEARLLIVDDTKMNLTVTVSLLKSTDIRIDTALSGAEAVTLAGERAYDLIFMDQRMPEMDGTEALRRIRERKDSPNSGTPVICLTADAIVGARERYLAEGFADYLSKPVNGGQLEAMLRKYLPEEKIIPVREEAGASGETFAVRPGGDTYLQLRRAGLDPDTGLNYCQGDEDLYRSLLTEYLLESQEKAEALRRDFATRDWKNYGILVHSLKSSSRMIGAQDLSEMAARLEEAANAGEEDSIRQEHDLMLNRYEEIVSAIRTFAPMREAADDQEEVFEFIP